MSCSEERVSASTPFLACSGFTSLWGRLEKLLFLYPWLGQEFLGASWPGTVCELGPESPEMIPAWLHLPVAIRDVTNLPDQLFFFIFSACKEEPAMREIVGRGEVREFLARTLSTWDHRSLSCHLSQRIGLGLIAFNSPRASFPALPLWPRPFFHGARKGK